MNITGKNLIENVTLETKEDNGTIFVTTGTDIYTNALETAGLKQETVEQVNEFNDLFVKQVADTVIDQTATSLQDANINVVNASITAGIRDSDMLNIVTTRNDAGVNAQMYITNPTSADVDALNVTLAELMAADG